MRRGAEAVARVNEDVECGVCVCEGTARVSTEVNSGTAWWAGGGQQAAVAREWKLTVAGQMERLKEKVRITVVFASWGIRRCGSSRRPFGKTGGK
jgi:hypothetical protein